VRTWLLGRLTAPLRRNRPARGPVDRPHLRVRVGGEGGRVEGGVLDVVAHGHHEFLAHRLDVGERAADSGKQE